MGAFSKRQLVSELIDRTELIISNTQSFRRLTNGQLTVRAAPGKWSIAEIFEHLNLTHRTYISPVIPKISNEPETQSAIYKSSWLGDFIYQQTMPRADGTILKLKARKLLRPQNNPLDGHDVLKRFLQQQDIIYDILQHASTKDLQHIKMPFSFTHLLKLRLGDQLRYLIAHNERHMLQAQRVMGVVSGE